VPYGWVEDKVLAQWVHSIRRKPDTSLVRQRILERVGLWWSRDDQEWGEFYTRLCQFKDRFGNCNSSQVSKDDPTLGKWVSEQRGARKMGTLSWKKINMLNAIGFAWGLRGQRKGKRR